MSSRPPARRTTMASIRDTMAIVETETVRHMFPTGYNNFGDLWHTHPMSTHTVPLMLSLFALGFTGAGSWGCSYFKGATIAFTGSNYGLWTLEDFEGKCQLWNVLFFSYNLGWHLILARVFSMTAMLLGLALLTTTSQAVQFHLVSWLIGIFFFVLFLISVSTTSIFNVWIVFWLFSYVILTLIVRYLFVHPVPRRISRRGERIIASLYVINGICCLLTLIVLRSDYCTCNNLLAADLDGRHVGEPCQGECRLGAAGIQMILASVCWFISARARFKYRLQPEHLAVNVNRPAELYAHYPKQSIYTRFVAPLWSKGEETSSNNKEETASLTRDGTNTLPESGGTGFGGSTGRSGESSYGTMRVIQEAESWGPEFEDEPDGDGEDNRGYFQKLCCDFRIKKRSRGEMVMFWTLRVMLSIMLVIYVFFIYMLVGSRVEYNRAGRAPTMDKYFTTEAVCAFDPQQAYDSFKTFENKESAHLAGYTIAHCGECGYCSNPHDIITYVETRKTIAQDSKKCGPTVYFGSEDDLSDCLQSRIDFTRECTECWTKDMISTATHCLSTCLTTLFSGFMTNNNVAGAGDQGWLNACVFCDEKMSGPGFVTCSGVARRRLGIPSEIERNPEQMCENMDVDWLDVKWEDIGFDINK